MVALSTGPGQTINIGEILREFLAMHVLCVQLRIRTDCVMGQTMVLGRKTLLVWISSSGKGLRLSRYSLISWLTNTIYCLIWIFSCSFYSRLTVTSGHTT